VSPRLLERIGTAGAVCVPFAQPPIHPFDDPPPLRGVVRRWVPQRLLRMAGTEARTALWSPAWATNVARQVRDAPPDVLVADFCLLGALAAAEAARIPSAALVHNAPRSRHTPPDHPPKGLGFQPARNGSSSRSPPVLALGPRSGVDTRGPGTAQRGARCAWYAATSVTVSTVRPREQGPGAWQSRIRLFIVTAADQRALRWFTDRRRGSAS